MSNSQKKIINGRSFLFPGDAIVDVSLCVLSPVYGTEKAPCWHLGAACTLMVAHANFPKKSHQFEIFRVFFKTGEMVVRNRPFSNETRIMTLPGIARSMDAVFLTAPSLTEFVIDAYIGGEVSDQKTLRFFRARYKEKLAIK